MWNLEGRLQRYAWGSTTALPSFLGVPADGTPWAELWFGTHPLAQATLEDGTALGDQVESDPEAMLGPGVTRAFRDGLPYLLKAIAPERPLSLQVHPHRAWAREHFAAENAAGLPLDSPERRYRDANHKPEMLVALSPFTALCGFRTPRRATEILEGLGTELTDRLHALLVSSPTGQGMHAALRTLLSPALRPDPVRVQDVVEACRSRALAGTSPSPRIDRIVMDLAAHHPGDPGVVAALLLNPVTLREGEALFVPSGALHAYIRGFGIEVAASSDNVLRAGLTAKRIDVDELLQCVSVAAAPPLRIAPEHRTAVTAAYYAPVDDFEVSMTTLPGTDGDPAARHLLAGSGPRILLGIDGAVRLESASDGAELSAGEAVFVPAAEGALHASGSGRVVQACVP